MRRFDFAAIERKRCPVTVSAVLQTLRYSSVYINRGGGLEEGRRRSEEDVSGEPK
jgi:hypothetical protein